MIRRIEIGKISALRLNCIELAVFNFGFLQDTTTCHDVIARDNSGIRVAPDRNVEFASFVDAIEAIETRFIEIDETRGDCDRVFEVVPIANHIIVFVIVLFSVLF